MSIIEAELVQSVPAQSSAALSLNPRQIAFVHYYLEVKVGWKAAELAGYAGDSDALCVTASQLLRNPKVAAYYEERLQLLQVSASEVLAEIGQIARYDVIANPQGPIRADHKLKALELAGKGHKLFTDKVESELSGNDVDRISDAVIAGLFAAAQRRQQETRQLPSNVTGSLEAS